MTSKCKIYYSDTFDPWFNLATEDWIFRDMDPTYNILFLWRNDKTVVIGRFQNPWAECNTKKMEEDKINLARRQSGGGAVFQDLGNTNFTFLNSKENFDKAVNNKIITKAINSFGLNSYPSGRNDILVDDHEGAKKISGSAFKETKDRSFHHGTLLINADLSNLANYLNPDKRKLQAKGISSVRSRVTNLSQLNDEINHGELCKRIVYEFKDHYQSDAQVEKLDNAFLKQVKPLNEYYERLKDWNWRFGETPQFEHHLDTRFEWGGVDVYLDTHKGIITKSKIFSDSLHPEMIEQVTKDLAGVSYDASGVVSALAKSKETLPMIADYLTEFETWLSHEIS